MIQRKQSFLSFFSKDKTRPKIQKRITNNFQSETNSNVILRDRKTLDNNSLSLSSKEYNANNRASMYEYTSTGNNNNQYLSDSKRGLGFQTSKERQYSRSNHNLSYSNELGTSLNNYENNNPNLRLHHPDNDREDTLDNNQNQDNTYSKDNPVGELNRKINETQSKYQKVNKSNTFRGKFQKYNKPARTKSDLSHLQNHRPKGRSTSNIYNAVNEENGNSGGRGSMAFESNGISNQLKYNPVKRYASMNKSYGDLKSNLYISTNKLNDGRSQFDYAQERDRDFDDLDGDIHGDIHPDVEDQINQVNNQMNEFSGHHQHPQMQQCTGLLGRLHLSTTDSPASNRKSEPEIQVIHADSTQFSKYVKKIKRRFTNAANFRTSNSQSNLSRHHQNHAQDHISHDKLGHRIETCTDSSGIVENKTNEDRSSLEESQRSQLDGDHHQNNYNPHSHNAPSPRLNHNITLTRGNNSRAEVIKLQGSNIYHSNVELNRFKDSKHKSRSIGHLKDQDDRDHDRDIDPTTQSQDNVLQPSGLNGATRNIKIKNISSQQRQTFQTSKPKTSRYRSRDDQKSRDRDREHQNSYSSDESSRSRSSYSDESGSDYTSDEDEGIDTKRKEPQSKPPTGANKELSRSSHNLEIDSLAKAANVKEKILNFESFSNNNKNTDLNNKLPENTNKIEKDKVSLQDSHDRKVKNKILASFAKSNFKNNPNFVKRSITSISAKGDVVRSKYANKGQDSYNNPFAGAGGAVPEGEEKDQGTDPTPNTKRYSSTNNYRNFIKDRFSPKSKFLNANTSTTITVGLQQLTPAQINEKIKKEIENNNKAQSQQLNLLMNKTMKWVMTQEFKLWMPEDILEYKNDPLTIQMGH